MLITSTWKELVDTFLEAVTPQEYLHPTSTQVIMDTYDDNRIKEMAQRSMGYFRLDNLHIERSASYVAKYE